MADLVHFFSKLNLNYTEKFAYDYAIKAIVWAITLTIVSTLANSLALKMRGKASTKGLPLQHPTFTALDDIEYDIPYVELKRYLQRQAISQPILLQIIFLLSSIGYFLAYLIYAVIPSILSSLGIIPILLSFLLTVPISIAKAYFLISVTCPPELKLFIKARFKKKSYSMIKKGYWQGRCVSKLYPSGFKLFALIITAYTILLPWMTSGSCLAYYTPGYGTYFDAYSLSTRLSRFFTMERKCLPGKICHIYSTLAEDASKSMIINVHTGNDLEELNIVYAKEEEEEPLMMKKVSKGRYVDIEWKAERYVHSIYLDNLEANTGYYVQFFSGEKGKYLGDTRFMTLPSNKMEANITLVTGGDSSGSEKTLKFMEYIAEHKPNVIVIGGDIVYDNGNINCYYCWDYYLELFGTLNNKVGRLVPIVLAVGNHDLGINSHQFREIDKQENLFFRFFPQHTVVSSDEGGGLKVPEYDERMPYFYHVLGNSLHVTLDSGYLHKFSGKQTEWLTEVSKKYTKYAKFAAYHVPIFSGCYFNPLKYGYDSRFLNWIPVFEKYNYMGVFENHVHLFKRTFPLSFTGKNKSPGVVYFGDGAWGVNENNCYYEDLEPNITGIFAKMGSINHIWIVKISAETVEYSAIDLNGNIIDNYQQKIKDYKSSGSNSSASINSNFVTNKKWDFYLPNELINNLVFPE